MFRKKYSGFTAQTPEKLLLDAGAFVKNYVAGESFKEIKATGRIIGATQGGGEFSAKPNVRQVPVDGVMGRAKGLELIDGWEAYIKATILEITPETLALSLGAAVLEDVEGGEYQRIKARDDIKDTDYIENIAWIGNLSGSQKPVVLIVKNPLALDGITLTPQDKNEAKLPVTMYGHYAEDDLETPPFEILYPKITTATTTTE